MKRLLYILVFPVILFSCQQDDLIYSCDPELNNFVTENKTEFSKISVTELASYDITLQRAVFRSWDAEKKRTAWLDKLEQVLYSSCLSEAETNHIQKLIDHIEAGYFSDKKIKKGSASRAKFAAEWLNYASNDLGWSGEFIAFLVYRLYTKQSQFEAELSVVKSFKVKATTNSESGTCNCNTAADYCGSHDCLLTGCSTGSGCGWLWSGTCNGYC
jgi:hypothetical protein